MNFSELGLAKRIVTDVEALGFVEPTEIQAKAIPPILEGRDIMASAETGSGKTAAYALPIIQALRNGSERRPRALVLVPTRELALQVDSQLERFSNKCGLRTVTIYGGVGFEKQTRLLKRGVDVIVATPGRLFDHMNRGNADLSNVKILVLDEADRMLDMGFTPQVRKIVASVPKTRQTIMFSATLSRSVEESAEEFLSNPVNVFVNTSQVEPTSIEQKVYHVNEDGKDDLLIKLIKENPDMSTVLVFTKTRWKATKVCKKLTASSVTADEIHGDISQNKREKTLLRYRDGEFSVLVATDIAARGLDIPAISHVINYDLPMSAADYVHRIGRTGRAGRTGVAVSFISSDQRYLVREIEKITGHALDPNGPAMPHDRKGGARPGRSSRNTGGSGHRRRPEDPTQFGGGVFGKRRDPIESGDRDSNVRGRGTYESRGNYQRTASSRDMKNGTNPDRPTTGGYQGDREGPSYRPNRRAAEGTKPTRDYGTDGAGNGFKRFSNRDEQGSGRPARSESGAYAGKREYQGDRPARPDFAGSREGRSDFRSGSDFGGNREGRPSYGNREGRSDFRSNRESRPDTDFRGAPRQNRSDSNFEGNREGRPSYGNREGRSDFRSNREARPDTDFRGVPRQNRSESNFDGNRESRPDFRSNRGDFSASGKREFRPGPGTYNPYKGSVAGKSKYRLGAESASSEGSGNGETSYRGRSGAESHNRTPVGASRPTGGGASRPKSGFGGARAGGHSNSAPRRSR